MMVERIHELQKPLRRYEEDFPGAVQSLTFNEFDLVTRLMVELKPAFDVTEQVVWLIVCLNI